MLREYVNNSVLRLPGYVHRQSSLQRISTINVFGLAVCLLQDYCVMSF
jgi:hypothetical protein